MHPLTVRQMFSAAEHPKVKDEQTSGDFIINSLKKYLTLTPILGHLLANNPRNIREFTSVLKSLHNFYQLQLPTSTTHPNVTRFTEYYGQIPKSYNPHPNYGILPPNNRRIPLNQLCSHRKALGILFNHTDAQWRD